MSGKLSKAALKVEFRGAYVCKIMSPPALDCRSANMPVGKTVRKLAPRLLVLVALAVATVAS